jgi:hypothetical protein
MLETRRREFIALMGGTAAAWPFAVSAQQPERIRRIGVLMGFAEEDQIWQDYLSNFRQRLQELGWAVCRNVQIDYRFTGENTERIRIAAEELVALRAGHNLCFHKSSSVSPDEGNAHDSDRLHVGVRFGWKRLRRETGASWRECHRVPQL